MAAPAPEQAKPAAGMTAAARPSVPAKEAQPTALARDEVAESAGKKAGRLRFGKVAEEASGLMPGLAAESASGAMPGMGGGYGGVGGPVASDAVQDREGQTRFRMGGRAEAAGSGLMPGGAARPSAGELASEQRALGAAKAVPSLEAEMGRPSPHAQPSSELLLRGKRGDSASEPTPSARAKMDAGLEMDQLADQPASRPAIPQEPPTASGASLTPADSFAASRPRLYREYARRSRTDLAIDGRTPRVETLFWEPLLETDARGQAALKFTLPDTATTYRVLIDGHAAGRIGSYLGRIVVRPVAAP
jgi:hypothetical protein